MAHPNPTTVIVNNRPFHLENDEVSPEQLRGLVDLPSDYEVWKIVGSPDPEGQLPANDVQVTGIMEVKNGDRFRVVPPGTFGAAATLPGTLSEEIEDLRNEGHTIEVAEEPDWIVLIFADWPLASGYSQPRTRLLLRIPRSYRFGKPDMFWTDCGLRLAGGALPRQASPEQILGREWLRFSWHSQKWDPSKDNLRSYLAFVEDGLSKART
jgi:E2/UBC family protein E